MPTGSLVSVDQATALTTGFSGGFEMAIATIIALAVPLILILFGKKILNFVLWIFRG